MNGVVGIDLGGTAIKHGLIAASAKLEDHDQRSTPKGKSAILAAMAEIIASHQARHTVQAVGVGTAGAVDFHTGTVIGHSPNIPGWEGTPIAEELKSRVDLPVVVVDNDANCMALAESRHGAGAGCDSVFFLTLGTGIGSAFVLHGELWRGAHSMGGEYGHATVVKDGRPCACGGRGHLEAYASATALVRRTLELARQGLPSVYGQVSDEAASVLGARDIFAAAAGGDAAAAQAASEAASYLATGIASAVNLLDPQRVVLGGGMADAGAPLLEPVRREVQEKVHVGLRDRIEVVPAQLGNKAGLIGAALLAQDALLAS
jgi:glucokinase